MSQQVSAVTVYPKFHLSHTLTKKQYSFFREYGFIHFENVLDVNRVNTMVQSIHSIEKDWVSKNIKKVNGVPIVYGKKIVHRFPFMSTFSESIHQFIHESKIQMLAGLMTEDSRIGEFEKDGIVVNQYLNDPSSRMSQMGWHTDSIRDLFYGFKINPMLNIGVYLTTCSTRHGGLRLIPKSHRQNLRQLLFRKKYYVNNSADKMEWAVEANAGDVTVHHGHIWHRVAPSEIKGPESRRIIMYLPVIRGPYEPKSEHSPTPFYHRLRHFAKK